MGISELTAALRQQRPRRDIHALPVVESNPSMHGSDAASSVAGASSSPSIISPFAALSHSPHEHSDGLSSTLEPTQDLTAGQHAAECAHDSVQQSAGTHSGQTPGAASPPGQSELSFSHQVVDQSPAAAGVQPESADAETEDDSASSDGSQQHQQNPGRAKCTVM